MRILTLQIRLISDGFPHIKSNFKVKLYLPLNKLRNRNLLDKLASYSWRSFTLIGRHFNLIITFCLGLIRKSLFRLNLLICIEDMWTSRYIQGILYKLFFFIMLYPKIWIWSRIYYRHLFPFLYFSPKWQNGITICILD